LRCHLGSDLPTDSFTLLQHKGATMQLRKAQMNRRDAMSAETDHSQPFENLSLEDDWFERRSQPLFSALIASLRFLCHRSARILWLMYLI
jgi:hypothetical protein